MVALAPSVRFPSDREVALNDAARIWNRPAYDASERVDKTLESDRLDTQGTQTSTEGSTLQFDMDSPVYAKKVGLLGVQTGVGLPSNVVAVQPSVDDNEKKRSGDKADTIARMKSIETDRIPCPRLCGASFGPGVGGLAVFHNGDVKKVWSWWERNHPTRLSTVPGLIGEPAPNEPSRPTPVSGGFSSQGGNTDDARQYSSRDCPRTLKDLNDMTSASKAAQWGDQDDSDVSSTGFPVLGYNFFEEESDASSDSGDDQNDDLLGGPEGKDSTDMYKEYFGGFQRPIATPAIADQGSSNRGADEKVGGQTVVQDNVVGASSDMLAPIVKVLYSYDDLALNKQSPDLAKGWKLGDIDAVDDSDVYEQKETLQTIGGRFRPVANELSTRNGASRLCSSTSEVLD